MKLLGVSGKIGSGKDHCTKLICKYFSFNQMSYGLKLKQVVALLTSSTLEECISHVGKNKYIEEFDLTIGQMQQKIGTDVMRTYFDENV
jgi:dephospho-CoA kinase